MSAASLWTSFDKGICAFFGASLALIFTISKTLQNSHFCDSFATFSTHVRTCRPATNTARLTAYGSVYRHRIFLDPAIRKCVIDFLDFTFLELFFQKFVGWLVFGDEDNS